LRTDSEDGGRKFEGFDIKKMFTEATSFVDSRSDILMQAVDVFNNPYAFVPCEPLTRRFGKMVDYKFTETGAIRFSP